MQNTGERLLLGSSRSPSHRAVTGVVLAALLGAFAHAQSPEPAAVEAAETATATTATTETADTPTAEEAAPFGRQVVRLQMRDAMDYETRGRWSQTGVRFFGPVSPNAYLARIDAEQLDALRLDPSFVEARRLTVEDKLTEHLYSGIGDRSYTTEDGQWTVLVEFYDDVNLRHALAVLDASELQPTDDSRLLRRHRLVVQATWEQVFVLAESDAVRSVREIALSSEAEGTSVLGLGETDDSELSWSSVLGLEATGEVEYDAAAGDWDQLVLDRGWILTRDASTEARTKNLITVARVDADDARIGRDGSVPTLVTPGGAEELGETIAHLADAYRNASGGLEPFPEVIRGALINTAVDLGEAGPDAVYGFGRVDARAALEVIEDARRRVRTISVDHGEEYRFPLQVPEGTDELSVTLNWLDPDVDANGALVNVIDLVLIDPNGVEHRPAAAPAHQGIGFEQLGVQDANATSGGNVRMASVSAPAAGSWWASVAGQNVPAGPQDLTLTGNGPWWGSASSGPGLPQINVNPSTVFFDVGCMENGSNPTETVTIHSTGAAPLVVSTIAFVGDSSTHWNMNGLPLSFPLVIPQGHQYSFTVEFDPQSSSVPGSHTGALRIQSNSQFTNTDNQNFRVNLVGRAGEGNPDIHIEGSQSDSDQLVSDFGNVKIGEVANLNVFMVNEGECELWVWDFFRVSGSGEFDQGDTWQWPVVLQPGSDFTFNVRYAPDQFSDGQAARFRFEFSRSPNGERETTPRLRFLGASPAPELSFTGSTDFGVGCLGDSVEQTVYVCNTGFNDLEVNVAHLSGDCSCFELLNSPFPSDYGYGDPVSVAMGACIPLTLAFNPGPDDGAAANGGCSLSLHTNDPDEYDTHVPLQGYIGYGEPFLQVDANGFYPDTKVGDISTLSFELYNEGDCDMVVQNLFEDVPDAEGEFVLDPVIFPLTIAPGSSYEFSISYIPSDFVDDFSQWLFDIETGGAPFAGPAVGVTLQAQSPPPVLTFSGTDDFGGVCAGDYVDGQVLVCNTGFNDIIVSNGSLEGACDGWEILIDPFANAPVAIGEDFCLPVDIRFTAPANALPGDVFGCALGITSNVDGAEVALSATVGPNGLFVTLENGGIFGDVPVGEVGSLTAQVVNDGDCDLTIFGLLEVVPNAHILPPAAGPAFPVVLAPGSHIDFPFSYQPQAYVPVADLAIWAIVSDSVELDTPLGFELTGTSPAPNIGTTGPTNFDLVCPRDVEYREINICNLGYNDLLVDSVFLVGDPEFSLTSNPFDSGPIAMGEDFCLPLTVRFEADITGMRDTTLIILSDDPDSPVHQVELNAEVGEPNVLWTQEANGDFSNVLIGQNHTLEVELVNQGDCPLSIDNVTNTIVDSEISLSTVLPNEPFVVLPGDSLILYFEYEPDDFDPDVAQWVVDTNDPQEPQLVLDFNGRSDPPDLAYTGSTRFGAVCVGEWAEIELDICNVGFNHLNVASVAFDPPCPEFSIENNPYPAPVSHDFCLPVTLRYTPDDPSDGDACTLRIISDSPGEEDVLIQITGFSPTGVLNTALESSGDFGNVKVGDFRTLDYLILNEGLCNLTLFSLAALPAGGPSEFSLGEQPGNPAFPLVLLPGESVQVQFRYQPIDFGQDIEQWVLTSDDPNLQLRQFALQGRSDPPDVELSGSPDFGTICPDEQPQQTLYVCNVGFNDLDVDALYFDPPCDDFELVNSPFPTVISKDFCVPFVVKFTPQMTGLRECTLVVPSNDPDEPEVVFNLRGYVQDVSIDVPEDITFPPTVVQSIDPMCESVEDFNIVNNGPCDLVITNVELVGYDPDDYELDDLPTLPLTLQPGHRLSNGHLVVKFKPNEVKRFLEAKVKITYVSHQPYIGDESTVYVDLCGEGVNTGFRVLVKVDGEPVPAVQKFQLWKILNPGPGQIVTWVDFQGYSPLLDVVGDPPCPSFQFHWERGGELDPQELQPGTYRVEATFLHQGHPVTVTEEFVLDDVCDFEADVCIDYMPIP